MNQIERVIELLLAASSPRGEHPPGELDRMRKNQISSWKRMNAAGILDAADLQKLIDVFDRALDYQRDHPLNDIDETLDSAMVIVQDLYMDECRAVSELVDDSVRSRLGTYVTRCASRAIADRSAGMCELGMRAYLLRIDQSGDKPDPREMMVSLAPLHVAAQYNHLVPASLFEQHAESAPDHIKQMLRDFGERTDVTLEAFGWDLSHDHPIQWIILSD